MESCWADNKFNNMIWFRSLHSADAPHFKFKINSVSSKDPKIHKAYKDGNTFFLDNFTHKIAVANENILK